MRVALTKLQSAMEYLMTYGWGILVIAIVLGVLYYFGVFSGPSLGNSCIGAAAYVCSNPLLNSTGNLSILFTQISGGAITITGVSCNDNITGPTSTVYINSTTLQSGNQKLLVFTCPGAGGPIGKKFAGYLWIIYNSGGSSGLVARIATVATYVSTVKALGQSGALLGYIPITITNSQSSATSAPFQQMLAIDSAVYANMINGNWMNVEFTTAPWGSGTLLQAWVESHPSNMATNTIVWISLPGGIAAGSNTVIYMDFSASNVMSVSGPTGEAPQLSPSYAQYDNGAMVFPQGYWNFAGSSLPAAWTGTAGFSGYVANGLVASLSGSYTGIYDTLPSGNLIIDGVGVPTASQAYALNFLVTPPAGNNNRANYNVNGYDVDFSGGGPALYRFVSAGTAGLSGLSFSGFTMGSNYIVSLGWSYPNLLVQVNYTTIASASDSTYNTLNYMAVSGYGGGTFTYYVVRLRSYPPGGAMPSASYGTFV